MQNDPQRPEDSAPFTPFVPAGTILPELSVGPIVLGVLLGILFGASSLYLTLRVGMSISASIPIATSG